MRDPKSRLLGNLDPPPHVPTEEKLLAKEVSPTRITSYMTPQEVENKAKQQQSMRRLLDEQMEERRWRGDEERRARLLEDQMEEERLSKQRQELEDDYRRELKSREQYETGQVRSEKLPAKSFAPPIPQSQTDPPRKPTPYQPSTYLSQPSKYQSPPSKYQSQPSKYLSNPFISDDRLQRLRADMAGRQQGLQDLIVRLKEESQGMALEKADALREFDQMRESIKNRAIENDQRARRQQLGSYYHSGPWRETYQPRVYQQESRFYPLAKAGRSVISTHSPVYEHKRSYEEVESTDVQMQLTKLDGILDYCRGIAEPQRPLQALDEIREAEKDMDERLAGGLEAPVDVEESAKAPEAMA